MFSSRTPSFWDRKLQTNSGDPVTPSGLEVLNLARSASYLSFVCLAYAIIIEHFPRCIVYLPSDPKKSGNCQPYFEIYGMCLSRAFFIAYDKMTTPTEGTVQPVISIVRKTPIQSSIDHTYITFLECRFKGTWQADSDWTLLGHG